MIDPDYANKILNVDCPYGSITLAFNEEGELHRLYMD